ncbi:hypothetical protein [Nitrosospira sp. Nsp1]|uniref:hypothetical protein n=1 Tax=Nitrosospira sp. Nsp1 TaxID=136547 RepID=UPI00115F8C4C|nr:hypothetical protein [Nitrosospira sp. Nsp1]
MFFATYKYIFTFFAPCLKSTRYFNVQPVFLLNNSRIWQPVGLKGNRLQKRLAGSYFAAFSANRITIDFQNPQNPPSPSHFFTAILQV